MAINMPSDLTTALSSRSDNKRALIKTFHRCAKDACMSAYLVALAHAVPRPVFVPDCGGLRYAARVAKQRAWLPLSS
jgi:hypothetical protein